MEGSTLSVVLVQMGGRRCAVPCEVIVEIVPRVLLEEVPEAPPSVLGVINLRGKVVPVMDVRERLLRQTGGKKKYQHMVIVAVGGRQVGFVADEVLDVLNVPADAVERPGLLAGGRGPGVVRIGEEMVLVLNPEDVLHALRA